MMTVELTEPHASRLSALAERLNLTANDAFVFALTQCLAQYDLLPQPVEDEEDTEDTEDTDDMDEPDTPDDDDDQD